MLVWQPHPASLYGVHVQKCVCRGSQAAAARCLQNSQLRARGAPGSKAGVADAILVQLQGGGQATVDLERGLAALPAGQRAEVQAQLLALRRLADAALGGGRGK